MKMTGTADWPLNCPTLPSSARCGGCRQLLLHAIDCLEAADHVSHDRGDVHADPHAGPEHRTSPEGEYTDEFPRSSVCQHYLATHGRTIQNGTLRK
jgi:hypothetical protein